MASTHTFFTKKSRKRLWFLVLPLVVALVALVVWLMWFSQFFAVEQVRAVNADQSALTEQQVREVLSQASIPIGEPIARVDTDTAARNVATLPWVQSVEVRRGWPHEIVVAVATRVPVASVTVADRPYAVDSTGVIFESLDIQDLPVIDAEGDSLVAAVEVLQSLPPNIAAKVVSISANSRDNVELLLKSGSTVRWGSSDEPLFKAQVLEALLTRRAEIYDVSAPEVPTTTDEKGPKKN
ncbi:MAG: cell division protein FtsQ/DivIB [Candidatus Nanopelagicales bacterium]|nr:cell division protein FtsQ/DivIB [Candidatus Nanopelagicales bacterium]MCF8550453.1 cell division protein FtsQ/DivIB [Candidatus Nanopelagicales bacterium]